VLQPDKGNYRELGARKVDVFLAVGNEPALRAAAREAFPRATVVGIRRDRLTVRSRERVFVARANEVRE
jgi:hypothetical protein